MHVLHEERAEGVDPRLLAFLAWWKLHGPFPILVLPKGGKRTDEVEQAELFAQGATRARTLAETPHGRAGALDVGPYINGSVPWTDKALFTAIGVLAEGHGLEWGGRWKPPLKPDSDHLQVPRWRDLPFPPPKTVNTGHG